MRQSLEPTLKFTLQHEGGYSSNRADPGNWTGGRVGSGQLVGTKYGLSAPLVVRDRGLCVTAQQMKLLTESDFRKMAIQYFWKPMECSLLPAGLDALVFDHGFNAGAKTSVRLLQQIVGVDQDGIVGPATLKAIGTVGLADVGRFCSANQIKIIQAQLSCPQTGLLDAQTLDAINHRGRRLDLLCFALNSQQLADYRSKKSFTVFGGGWIHRADERLQLALSLVYAQPVVKPAPASA
ncbi:glycosyl hydrolase 108 family protein [Bombella apis]|uniref:glycosyl hydrolase 108 family protein n=1 Tax=Bombella apis TaxID=1785988 RepID=UPI0024A968BA|nr:glycosyl hydrolase 108 family protein [Bombella apis]